MPLRGELNSVDLAHVFQMLVLNQKAGTLEIQHEGVKHRLLFAPGGVMVPFEADVLIKRAARALVRSGAITSEQVERARHNMSVLGCDLLRTLVEMRVVTDDQRRRAMREQLEEDVYELFFLLDATFEFRDGEEEADDAVTDPELALSPNGIIMEAARRVDEWEYIRRLVPSGNDIVEPTGDLSALPERERTPDVEAVYAAADGFSSIDDIVRRTSIARFVVFRGIALMLDHGALSSVPEEALVARGAERLDAGDAAAAANLFERAIDAGVTDLDVLSGAGQAYETLGRAKDAAARYLAAGRRAEESGDLSAAVGLYRRIKEILPSQVEARERLFALRKVARAHMGDEYDPAREGWALATILSELGRTEELILVLGGLLDLAGDDPARIEDVADRAARMGHSAYAVDALLLAAEHRREAKEFRAALRVLKAAQALDPSRADLASRIHALGGHVERDRARRRSVVRGMLMAAGFAMLFLGYGRYSQAALQAFGRWSLEDFVATGEFERGKEHYRDVIRRYPLTIPFLLSFEKMRELDTAERNAREVAAYRERVEEASHEDRMRQAEVLRKGALSARRTGDWSHAADLLRKARDLCAPEDPLDIGSSLAELDEYLAAARRLKSEATFYRNAGRFDEAHARLVELVGRYLHSGSAQGVLIPVRIETDPPRASISRGGVPVRLGDGGADLVAETPFVLDLPPDQEVTLELRLDGYVPVTARVSPQRQSTLRLSMPRPPEHATILPHRIIAPPVTSGGAVAVSMERGHVGVLDAARLTVRWVEALPDLTEVVGSPWIDGDALLVATSLGELVRVRPTGGAGAPVPLPGRPRSGPVGSARSLAVVVEGGAVAVGPASGPFARVALPAECVVGPVPVGDGRFALACADGKVWVVGAGGSLTVVPGRDGGGGATTLAVLGDRLFIGDDRGQLSVHEFGGGETSTVAVLDEAVTGISPGASRVVVAGARSLATVDLATVDLADDDPAVVATSSDGGWLVDGASSDVVVFDGEGWIRVRSRDDLSVRATYSAEATDPRGGVVAGGRAIVAAESGKVVGILYPSR